jgi:protocatechuate 3,4-dioxygenase beta subunit
MDRRRFIVSGAAAVSAMRVFAAEPACRLVAEQEEGPYYVPTAKLRRVVTENKTGVPLRLQVRMVNARTCAPLPDAAFDIWHCDAEGIYSGFTAMGSGFRPGGAPPGGFGSPPDGFTPRNGRGPGARKIDATRFLRGVQITDQAGTVEFETLYPGWYQGRTIHIHMKVYLAGSAHETYEGGHVSHTGQIFLPEELTERIAKMSPYVGNSKVHRTTQAEDHVFQEQHGDGLIADVDRLANNGNEFRWVRGVDHAGRGSGSDARAGGHRRRQRAFGRRIG